MKEIAIKMGHDATMSVSDTMPSVKVARKKAFVRGLAPILFFALASCEGAAGAGQIPNSPPMPTAIAVTVPDAGWRLRVERVVAPDAEVWVLAQLRREPGPATQMIQQAKAEIPIALPEKRLRVFVAGKTWAWPNNEPYEFVASLDDVMRRAGSAQALYPVPAK